MADDLAPLTFSARNRADVDVRHLTARPKDLDVLTVDGVELAPDSPLRVLYDEMRMEPNPDATPEQQLIERRLRIEAAKVLAPFLRPKLAQIEHLGNVTLSHEDALKALE